MDDPKYFDQAELVTRLLPLVAREDSFALKGGTAINFFVRDLPRLSVDIDLTFVPRTERSIALRDITAALSRIQASIKKAFPEASIQKGGTVREKLVVSTPRTLAKIEVNTVVRGALYPCEERRLCKGAIERFQTEFALQCLSLAEIFGGKLCAAFDRQHPRDFFDIKLLLETEGLHERVRKAFVVGLASHGRTMNEVLDPTWKDIQTSFNQDFAGMTNIPITAAELKTVGPRANKLVRDQLTKDERMFLLSVKDGTPDWPLLGVPGAEGLPGIQWKVVNIRKMDATKRKLAFEKLKAVLEI